MRAAEKVQTRGKSGAEAIAEALELGLVVEVPGATLSRVTRADGSHVFKADRRGVIEVFRSARELGLVAQVYCGHTSAYHAALSALRGTRRAVDVPRP